MPWLDSYRLREQIDSYGFLSGFNRAIAAQTVHVFQAILLAQMRPLMRSCERLILSFLRIAIQVCRKIPGHRASDQRSTAAVENQAVILAATRGVVHSVAMRVAVGKIRDSHLTIIHPALPAARPLAKSVRLSQLRKNRKCEQVAAVCYRIRNGAIEFLLVQTRNRKRWTFPKGSAEPGLSHAQAAALEAFEEAGVHGRIEETPFTEYLRYRRCDKQNLRGSSVKRPAVSAHLCEVLSLRLPKESNRNRTWFSVQETRQSLRLGRGKEEGDEFVRVVDAAVRRIQRLQREAGLVADRPRLQPDGLGRNARQNDELQRVHFEYPQIRRRSWENRQSSAPAKNLHRIEVVECELLPFGPSRLINRTPRLLPGAKKPKALGAGAKIG